nr:beta-glucosidase 3 isoform X2 [Arachis hypogaea]XP_025623340.1 beta-glucosidase 3 isoform X2 [Arachis hypogaea]
MKFTCQRLLKQLCQKRFIISKPIFFVFPTNSDRLGFDAVQSIIHAGGSTVSDDFMLQEDVKLMVEIGLDVYRLSISWSRLIPNGEGPINPKGLQFYNNSRGDSTIEPYLAVHHIFLSHFSVVRLYRRKYKMKTGQPLKEPVIFLLVVSCHTMDFTRRAEYHEDPLWQYSHIYL